MENVLILDVETTGLDPTSDSVVEVGAILYSVPFASPVVCYSSVIGTAAGNAAETVNRIPDALVRSAVPYLAKEVWTIVHGLAMEADLVLAYGASFDRSFTPPGVLFRQPWVCALDDLSWPLASRPGLSLVALALDHGLGVASAHRALADCDLLARLLGRCAELGHDVEAMLQRGLRPKVTVAARVSYAERELARAAGFRWDPERKQWLRRLAEEDLEALPFGVLLVEDSA